MRSLKAASLIALLATPALGDGFKYIPKWHLVELNGETQACYGFEDAKKLASLDIDLATLDGLKKELPELMRAHAEALAAQKKLREALEAKNAELETQRDALMKALRVSEEARIKAETNSAGTVGWVVAGGVLLIAVGEAIALGIVTSPKAP